LERERRPIITLIGPGQAKLGMRFLHKGGTPKCEGCQYRRVCIENLEPGRIYKIVGVREKTLFCEAYGMEMVVVEVTESEVEAAIPSGSAIEGAIISFKNPECTEDDCENYRLCFPEGLKNGDRSQILEVDGSLKCRLRIPLRRVRLLRVRS